MYGLRTPVQFRYAIVAEACPFMPSPITGAPFRKDAESRSDSAPWRWKPPCVLAPVLVSSPNVIIHALPEHDSTDEIDPRENQFHA